MSLAEGSRSCWQRGGANSRFHATAHYEEDEVVEQVELDELELELDELDERELELDELEELELEELELEELEEVEDKDEDDELGHGSGLHLSHFLSLQGLMGFLQHRGPTHPLTGFRQHLCLQGFFSGQSLAGMRLNRE